MYYFTRRQGFTSVPSQGGSTLGMSTRHNSVRQYTLGEFAMEQERLHREMLREHLREEKLNSLKLKVKILWFWSLPLCISMNSVRVIWAWCECFNQNPFLAFQSDFNGNNCIFSFLLDIMKCWCGSKVLMCTLKCFTRIWLCTLCFLTEKMTKADRQWNLASDRVSSRVWKCQEVNKSSEPLHSALLEKAMVTS